MSSEVLHRRRQLGGCALAHSPLLSSRRGAAEGLQDCYWLGILNQVFRLCCGCLVESGAATRGFPWIGRKNPVMTWS